jgi:Leucine-rich repeat (LRR) protein
VEPETRIVELRLDHNLLRTLDGALMGVHGLQKLNLSSNLLEKIAPDDLIGLEDLRILDVSFNRLTTLEETSKVQLGNKNYVHIAG